MGLVVILIAVLAGGVILKFALGSASGTGGGYAARTAARATALAPIKAKGGVNPKRRFVAIDFETANSRYYSACSLGMVVFENLQPVFRKTWLLNPDSKFDPENVRIHGITPERVADAPKFDAIWLEFVSYIRGVRIVAYSEFDAKVLKSLVNHYHLMEKTPGGLSIDYFDVCQCSRDTIVGLTNYKLPTVCSYLGIAGLNHHDACSDAEACGKIYCWITKNNGRRVVAARGDPATYAQQDYIRNLGGVVPPTLTKAEASALIDSLIRENEERRYAETEARHREREEKREREKAARKAEKDAEKAFARRKKEEESLKLLADEMSDPEYKARKSRSKRIQDLKEFQVLVNSVIADNVIEPAEILQIKAWLVEHRVLEDDFRQMFGLIDKSLEDGRIDDVETQSLYEGMLDCISTLRKRQAQ